MSYVRGSRLVIVVSLRAGAQADASSLLLIQVQSLLSDTYYPCCKSQAACQVHQRPLQSLCRVCPCTLSDTAFRPAWCDT